VNQIQAHVSCDANCRLSIHRSAIF